MKNLFGLILLAVFFACNAPRQAKMDHTTNRSRVAGAGQTTAGARGKGRIDIDRKSNETGFLDEIESPTSTSVSRSSEVDSEGKASNPAGRTAVIPAKEKLAIADLIVLESQKVLGTRYRYAGDSPSRGFDCSGLTCYLFRKADIPLPRTSTEQSRIGKRKKFEQALEGDLVFFGTGQRVTHVAVVVERGRNSMTVVHSTNSGGVRYDEVFSSRYWNSRKLWAIDLNSLTD